MFRRSLSVCGVALVAAVLLTWNSLDAQQPVPASTSARVDFARDILPIFQKNCYECHSAKKSKGHLRLDLRALAMKGGEDGPIIIPGNGEKSRLVRRLLGLDGDDRMPKNGDPLPAD